MLRRASARLSIGLVLADRLHSPILKVVVFAFNGCRQQQQGPGQLGLREKKKCEQATRRPRAQPVSLRGAARNWWLFSFFSFFFSFSFRSGRTNRLFFLAVGSRVHFPKSGATSISRTRHQHSPTSSPTKLHLDGARSHPPSPRSSLGRAECALIVWKTLMFKQRRDKARGNLAISPNEIPR